MTDLRIRLAVTAAGAALLISGCSDDGTDTTTTTATRTATATQSAPAYTGTLPERPAAGAPVDCTYIPDGDAAKDDAATGERGEHRRGARGGDDHQRGPDRPPPGSGGRSVHRQQLRLARRAGLLTTRRAIAS